MPKTRAKPVNCNIHNENGEDFLIYDWVLIKVEENFSVQTCDHLKDEVYRLLNFFETPLQIYYRYMKVNNPSKSLSLAFSSSENCVGGSF